MGSLDEPAVPPELFAAVDAAPGDAGYDPSGSALMATGAGVVGLVGMNLEGKAVWATAPAVSHQRDRIKGWGHHHAIVAVGPSESQAEGRVLGIGDEAALGPRVATIRRVWAGGRVPFFAETDALSKMGRLQSS